MFEYVFLISYHSMFIDKQIEIIDNIKHQCSKLIIGIFSDRDLENILGHKRIEGLSERKKTLQKYASSIIMINSKNPYQSFEKYISQNIQHINSLKPISIGSSHTQTKIVKNDNNCKEIHLMHNYKDIFQHEITNEQIVVKRIDLNEGWGQNLEGYKKKWCFVKFANENNFTDKVTSKIKTIMPINKLSFDIYSNATIDIYESMQVDWIVGWVNPNSNNISFSESHNIQRIRDNNELLYCLKSILKYASWVNKIYIILAGDSEKPAWLNENDKIVLVQETDLYKNIQRNSETKKIFYGKIPNISDFFIAGDDDYFLGDYIYKSDFFGLDKRPIVNSVHCGGGRTAEESGQAGDGDAHIPISWNKQTYNLAIENINSSNYLHMGNKRANPWVEIKEYLQEHNLIINGNKKRPDCWINNTIVDRGDVEEYFNFIKYSNPQFVCINDDWSLEEKIYLQQKSSLKKFYETFFPDNDSTFFRLDLL